MLIKQLLRKLLRNIPAEDTTCMYIDRMNIDWSYHGKVLRFEVQIPNPSEEVLNAFYTTFRGSE